MSMFDVIAFPGTKFYGRRIVVDAWVAAGSPPINSGGRLYADQKYYWDGYAAGLPGFNGADNPDDPNQALGHVRFVAVDIDPTPDRIRRLEAAGLERPYRHEPWHWAVPNVWRFALVTELPKPQPIPEPSKPVIRQEDEEMLFLNIEDKYLVSVGPGILKHWGPAESQTVRETVKNIARINDDWQNVTLTVFAAALAAYGCDKNIWDVRTFGKKTDFCVLNPLDGTVKQGNTWTAVNQMRADMRKVSA